MAPDARQRMGHERYLPPGTSLTLKRYRARSESWEHDHRLFCFAKFMDPNYSEGHPRGDEQPAVLTEGYTRTVRRARGADWHWSAIRAARTSPSSWRLRVSPG